MAEKVFSLLGSARSMFERLKGKWLPKSVAKTKGSCKMWCWHLILQLDAYSDPIGIQIRAEGIAIVSGNFLRGSIMALILINSSLLWGKSEHIFEWESTVHHGVGNSEAVCARVLEGEVVFVCLGRKWWVIHLVSEAQGWVNKICSCTHNFTLRILG